MAELKPGPPWHGQALSVRVTHGVTAVAELKRARLNLDNPNETAVTHGVTAVAELKRSF